MEYETEVTWCVARRRMGLTASGLIIWRNYLPLATFSLREARRRYPQILYLLSFAKICALCAHDLERILVASRSCAQATRALVPS
jgi:hypothetical protein